MVKEEVKVLVISPTYFPIQLIRNLSDSSLRHIHLQRLRDSFLRKDLEELAVIICLNIGRDARFLPAALQSWRLDGFRGRVFSNNLENYNHGPEISFFYEIRQLPLSAANIW